MPATFTAPATRIAQRYLDVRKHSERLCAPLEKEDFVVQPVVDVSPPKWHLAHRGPFVCFDLKTWRAMQI